MLFPSEKDAIEKKKKKRIHKLKKVEHENNTKNAHLLATFKLNYTIQLTIFWFSLHMIEGIETSELIMS